MPMFWVVMYAVLLLFVNVQLAFVMKNIGYGHCKPYQTFFDTCERRH
jgi:hypothetical protein